LRKSRKKLASLSRRLYESSIGRSEPAASDDSDEPFLVRPNKYGFVFILLAGILLLAGLLGLRAGAVPLLAAIIIGAVALLLILVGIRIVHGSGN
jgi:hypothetical protein